MRELSLLLITFLAACIFPPSNKPTKIPVEKHSQDTTFVVPGELELKADIRELDSLMQCYKPNH